MFEQDLAAVKTEKELMGSWDSMPAGFIGLDTSGKPVFAGPGLTPQQAIGGGGREWATHYTKAGAPGTKAWLQARAEDIRIEAAQAKLKSTDALSRAIAAADIIKASGKVYTRVGYQKELARLGGFSTVGGAVSALRYGTKTEAQYYKEYGVSQEAMRKAEASARAAEQARAARPERAETWLETQPQFIQKGIGWMDETPSPQQWLAETRIAKKVAPSLIKVREKGGRALFLLGKSRQAISEGLRPEEKEKRIELEKSDKTYSEAVKKYNEEVKQLDKDISRFSTKYLKKPVPQKDIDIAYAKQDELQSKAVSLEGTRTQLEEYEIERTELIKQYDIKIKAVPKVVKWARSMWVGALSVPIVATELGIGLAVKPEETIAGAFTGIWGLPKAIKERPIETVTELGVSSVVFGLSTKAISGAVSRAGIMKVKPKVTQSFSVGKSVKIGKRGELNLWKVEGKIITKLKHPKTGKTIETFSTKTFSDTVTSPTKSGAIKAYSKTLGTTLRTGDIRLALGRTPKVKMKASLTEAKGELTLSPTDVEKYYKGYGEFGIREIGKVEMKYPITKAPKVITKVKLRPGKEFEGISNVWAKQLGGTRRIDIMKLPKKDVGIVMAGKEYTYAYKALTDIYGKEGAKLIIRAREKGIAKAYVPEEGMLFLGKEFKPIKLKARIPEYKPTPIDMYGKPIKISQQFQQLITGTPEKAVAGISAKTIQKAIGEVLVKKAKPVTIPKAITKVTPMAKAMQLISPAPALITKQQLREEERLRAASLVKMGLVAKPRVREEQKYIQGINAALAQSLGTKQVQVSKLAQFPAMVSPAVSIVPSPITKIPMMALPPYGKKETQLEKKRRKAKEAKIRKQQRAYQASVAAAVLGITITKKEARKLPKIFTGLELRPIIKNNYYEKGGSKKMLSSRKSSRKSVARLKAQQKALVKSARGGRQVHKRRIQKEQAEHKRRIKLYKSKRSQVKALKTKALRKRKPKRRRIINRLNKLFK